MNKKYVSPEIEYFLFDYEDAIVTSTPVNGEIKSMTTPLVTDTDLFTDPGGDGPVIGK